MTWFRHAPRFVGQTVAELVKANLATLGWTNANTTPFGAPVVTFIETWPQEWQDIAKLQPGSVAFTVGDEAASVLQELGGPLSQQDIPIFIDVYMGKEAHALALATDIRDICMGRIPGTGPTTLSLMDYRNTPPTAVPGWTIELTDTVRETPRGYSPLWQVVKTTASTFFQEVIW